MRCVRIAHPLHLLCSEAYLAKILVALRRVTKKESKIKTFATSLMIFIFVGIVNPESIHDTLIFKLGIYPKR